MKNLTKYICEALNPVRIILNKINLSGIPNKSVIPGTEKSFSLAYEQEEFVIAKLKESYPEYDWVHNSGEDSSKNLTEGDITVKKDNKIVAHIDVKVAGVNEKGNLLGTVDINSILNFATKQNTWYICINSDGSKHEFINGDHAYDIFVKSNCLYQTTRKDRDDYLDKDIQKYTSKIIKKAEDINAEKINWVKCVSDNVSKYDFIPTFKMFPKYTERKQSV